MSSSVPYDPYIPNQTTGEQSNSRTAAIQAVSTIFEHQWHFKGGKIDPRWMKEHEIFRVFDDFYIY